MWINHMMECVFRQEDEYRHMMVQVASRALWMRSAAFTERALARNWPPNRHRLEYGRSLLLATPWDASSVLSASISGGGQRDMARRRIEPPLRLRARTHPASVPLDLAAAPLAARLPHLPVQLGRREFRVRGQPLVDDRLVRGPASTAPGGAARTVRARRRARGPAGHHSVRSPKCAFFDGQQQLPCDGCVAPDARFDRRGGPR